MNLEEFIKDVSGHKMQILRDDGLYRHIRFKRESTSCYYFDLITWPGVLCYTGDMGTFVFSRIPDMFEFFRTDSEKSPDLRINPGYWSEKLLSVDGGRHSASAMEFDQKKFERVIKEYLVSWMRESGLNRTERRELRLAVEEDVIQHIDDDERGSFELANDFDVEIGGQEFRFEDLWDHSFRKFTRTYLWCCYALSWGIRQYDERPAAEGVAP